MEGTLSYSARHKRIGQDRHAGKHSHGLRRYSWTSQRKDRTETDSSEVTANQDARARPRLGPYRGVGTGHQVPAPPASDQTGQASLR